MEQAKEQVVYWIHQAHEIIRRQLGLPERLVDHPPVQQSLSNTLDALAMTVFPAGGAIPYSGRDTQVAEYVLEHLRKIPRQESELIVLIFLLYEHVLPKLLAKGWTFSSMVESQRVEMLEHLHNSPFFPLRFLNITVRMFLSLGYMADERVLREMGFFKRHEYPGDPRKIEIRWWPLRQDTQEDEP